MIKEKTRYGLPLATIEQIHGVFRQFPKIEKAVLFGSRAMRKGRHNSDVDLALYGEELTAQDAIDIAAALDDLPTPYKIDISCFATLTHGKLRDHIERRGVIFYERVGDGNPLPKRWKMVKLRDVCEYQKDNGCKTVTLSIWGWKILNLVQCVFQKNFMEPLENEFNLFV